MNVTRSRTMERSRPRLGETVIVFSVAGAMFAIAASAVDEIRDLTALQKFTLGTAQQRLARVKQTLERQGRRYFVVDACEHFHLAMARPSRLLVLRHAAVAVAVDAIDCMLELNALQALPRAFSGEERNWYRGLAVVKGRVVPVIRPEAFLSKAEVALIESAIQGRESVARAVAKV